MWPCGHLAIFIRKKDDDDLPEFSVPNFETIARQARQCRLFFFEHSLALNSGTREAAWDSLPGEGCRELLRDHLERLPGDGRGGGASLVAHHCGGAMALPGGDEGRWQWIDPEI